MAMKQMERGGKLDVFGTREYGQDVRTQNITAVSAVANIIKSSLGPVGLDKVRVPHEPIVIGRTPARDVGGRFRSIEGRFERERSLKRTAPFRAAPQEVANELDLGLFGLALFRRSS